MISRELRRAFEAWSENPTPRTHAHLIAKMVRMDEAMHSRGMEDVYHEDIGMSCPRELRAIIEFYKVWEGQSLAAVA